MVHINYLQYLNTEHFVSLWTIQQWIDGNKDLVTGARSGIGFEIALELARRGTATVHHIKVCNSVF